MRVLIVTGLSGGHIYPALALADYLKDFGEVVQLVLPQKDSQDNKLRTQHVIKYIHAVNLGFKLNKKNVVNFCFFLLSFWESFLIFLKFKPDVVVGFGSLNTVALVFWSWLFRVKTIIHEQNVICGRANKFLSKIVDRIAISFDQTRNDLNVSKDKIVLTGNPLRSDLVLLKKNKALDFFKFSENKFTVLIIGGSQGSHKLNVVCSQALSNYPNNSSLQVIHLCGVHDFIWLNEAYANLGLDYKLFDFFYQMQYAYSAADLIICRAGATTITELQQFKVPAILIPYPFAYAHQLANAKVLANIGAAEVLSDIDLSALIIKEKIQDYFCNKEKLILMQVAYQKLPVLKATVLLANQVLSLN